MLMYPHINPIALQIGPLAVHWYGVTYLAAFALFYFLGSLRLRHEPFRSIIEPGAWTRKDLEDILFLGVVGVIVGGRLGYCLFYKPAFYLSHPLEILFVWQGGMSFHGGFIGVLVAMLFYAHKRGKRWLDVMDFVAPMCPLGLAAGRLGNFINAELWGRPTDVPWAMIFPNVDNLPRHPSQLYEFGLEGIVLFIILWTYALRPRPLGAVSGLFLLGYGVARFLVEFTREPDSFLGLLAGGLSMGQWLSLPMIAIGALMMLWAYARARKDEPTLLDRMK